MELYSIKKLLFILTIISLPLFAFATTLDNQQVVEDKCNTSLDIKEYAKCSVEDRWDLTQWDSFYNILDSESNWCHTKWNGQKSCPDVPRDTKLPGHSNAYGLCQTMLSKHGLLGDIEFMNNPYQQVDWCIDYAESRYGSPSKAWDYWKLNRHW